MKKKNTVYAAISGGVDSAVAAALLKERGYNIRGIFLREYDFSLPSAFGDSIHCSQEGDRQSALAVAAALDIPFEEWDFRAAYERAVIRYMVREYKAGRTPNPDMMCNSAIKFGLFMERALREGADGIATGHYARITRHPEQYVIPAILGVAPAEAGAGIQTRDNYNRLDSRRSLSRVSPRDGNDRRGNDIFKLLQAQDKNKDQTYFLSTLTQEQLKRCLFPIGNLLKSEVRQRAKKFGLPNWNRKDSQGICFIGKLSMRDFLKTAIPHKKGPLMTRDGQRVGTHDGAAFFTIGQRHGLGFEGGGEPYYVVNKDMKKNIVIVDHEQPSSALYKKELVCSAVHWIFGKEPALPLRCRARVRYRQALQSCTVTRILKKHNRYRVIFSRPQRAITPGQSAVFYKESTCLGGGIID